MTACSVIAHDSGGHGISTIPIQKHTISPVESCIETQYQIHKSRVFGDNMMKNSFQQRERESQGG